MANTTTRSTVHIERTFDAPRELVWKAWTDPARVREWWGPEHYDCPDAKIDLRVGGYWRFAMRGPDGATHYSGGVYRDVTPMDRLVYTDNFMDAEGNRMEAAAIGLPGDWPDELILTVTFADAPGGKTVVTITHQGMPNEMLENATLGWNSSLDKLAASLQ
jgi:uncharacterized protein YndB with AHSA1/START domain